MGAIALAVGLGALPAEAASKKKTDTQHATRAAQPRPRVVVTRRSYFDAGTEVLPGGDRKFFDYVEPPGFLPSNYYDPTGSTRSPLPGRFYLPGWSPDLFN